jgi:hypothetical protein
MTTTEVSVANAIDQQIESGRVTLSERAFSFFKKAPPKEFVLAPNIYNKNLKHGMPQ